MCICLKYYTSKLGIETIQKAVKMNVFKNLWAEERQSFFENQAEERQSFFENQGRIRILVFC